MVSYHHVQHQKKLMIQSWENSVTDRRKDRRTDKQNRLISQDAVRLLSSVQNINNLAWTGPFRRFSTHVWQNTGKLLPARWCTMLYLLLTELMYLCLNKLTGKYDGKTIVLIFWYTLYKPLWKSESSISHSFLAAFPFLVMQRISSFILSTDLFWKKVLLIFFDPFLFFV